MSLLEEALLVVLPAAGLVALYVAMERWGRRRDPMGGKANDAFSTRGTQDRARYPED